MKRPKRNMENTTTKMERLLLLRPFIAPVSEVNRGVFLRRGCMGETEERSDIRKTTIISEERRSKER